MHELIEGEHDREIFGPDQVLPTTIVDERIRSVRGVEYVKSVREDIGTYVPNLSFPQVKITQIFIVAQLVTEYSHPSYFRKFKQLYEKLPAGDLANRDLGGHDIRETLLLAIISCAFGDEPSQLEVRLSDRDKVMTTETFTNACNDSLGTPPSRVMACVGYVLCVQKFDTVPSEVVIEALRDPTFLKKVYARCKRLEYLNIKLDKLDSEQPFVFFTVVQRNEDEGPYDPLKGPPEGYSPDAFVKRMKLLEIKGSKG